ncbi:type II toxin-antitoxin system VapC family toxin [Devosia sp. Root635]|uniref:type II toxin-antitoxin system VapC family toxin n=1 Tax=Devosia sp. Root635 TaxID=1736575 RepID=UPI0006F2A7BA|nr:type II toxin-antitoxin system VapC family toxin [Devosia sp. Root635]KRA56084.1 transcriptional regulator [Devosia sp. Root635]
MLDTNIMSHFMRFPAGHVAERIRRYNVQSTGISIIVASELRYGIARVNSQRLQHQIEWALSFVTILPLEPPVDEIYANLRDRLAKEGRPIGPNDLFIAAHALALNVPLVTDNIGEFSRVPDLRVENWLD